jgi:hypothetical protein
MLAIEKVLIDSKSKIKSIHGHAVRRFAESVNIHVGNARPAILHMYGIGHDATDYELHYLGMQRNLGVDYRITDTCYGRYMMIVKDNCIWTLWEIKEHGAKPRQKILHYGNRPHGRR